LRKLRRRHFTLSREWNREIRWLFDELKSKMASTEVLAHYNTQNASAFVVSVVLSHLYEDGSKRPITNASRTLSK